MVDRRSIGWGQLVGVNWMGQLVGPTGPGSWLGVNWLGQLARPTGCQLDGPTGQSTGRVNWSTDQLVRVNWLGQLAGSTGRSLLGQLAKLAGSTGRSLVGQLANWLGQLVGHWLGHLVRVNWLSTGWKQSQPKWPANSEVIPPETPDNREMPSLRCPRPPSHLSSRESLPRGTNVQPADETFWPKVDGRRNSTVR